ncbi:hypothetical protein ACJX0J_034129, partial [Zea mays]
AGVSHLGFGGSLGRLVSFSKDMRSLMEPAYGNMKNSQCFMKRKELASEAHARCNLMFETIPKFARCNLMLQSYIERHTYSLHYIVYDKSQVKANQLPVANMIGYLEAKNHLLLGYCQDIVYYLLRKAKGLSVDGHPIVWSLIEIRLFLEK